MIKLEYKDIPKAIKYSGKIETSSYIHKLLFDNAEIVSAEWFSLWDSKYNTTKPTREDAQTYRECTDTEFYFKHGVLYAEHHTWDGDNMYGHRLNRRCNFLLKIENKKSELLDYVFELIEKNMRYQAVRIFEQNERNAREQAEKRILENLYDRIKE